MSKVKNIINGYKNLIITDEVLQPLFDQRYETCVNCDNNIAGICQLCLCVCKAKSHSALEDCPAHFWQPVHYVDNGFDYVLKSELPINLQQYFEDEEIELKIWLDFLEKGE